MSIWCLVCGWVRRGCVLSKESGIEIEKILVSMNRVWNPTFILGNILPYFGLIYPCCIMRHMSHDQVVVEVILLHVRNLGLLLPKDKTVGSIRYIEHIIYRYK